MEKQNLNHINRNIKNVFHFLELKGIESNLIGSKSIKGLLYANDYDLNTELNQTNTISILNKLYNEFKHMFNEAFTNKNIYILKFKNGIYEHESIIWSHDDINKGYRIINEHKLSFQECLLHDDNKLKLDICYINNNLFTDINMLYNFVINDKPESKEDIIHSFNDAINECKENGNYFKAIKKMFQQSIISDKIDEELLELINSNYGLMYKIITSLQLVFDMIEQKFKPISKKLININLEHIKNEASVINQFDITEYLDEINSIIDTSDIDKVKLNLDIMIKHAEYFLNELLRKNYRHIIFGGKIGMTMPTLHKMLDNSYTDKDKQEKNIDGYIRDDSLSGNRAQVYHNKETNHLIVAHRGTQGVHDVGNDIKLMFGMKKNKRFKHGKDITDKALSKYKTDNVSVIGHSLGATIARDSNDKRHETIGVNGAMVPMDLLRKEGDDEHVIRSKYDVVSALHTINPNKNKSNTITLDNNHINPLKAHDVNNII